MLQAPETFRNFFDALYFSITTLTSVGFGDITPVTAAGKAVTSVAILAYSVLIPYELALLAQSMGIMDRMDQPSSLMRRSCGSCGVEEHQVRPCSSDSLIYVSLASSWAESTLCRLLLRHHAMNCQMGIPSVVKVGCCTRCVP